MTDETNESDAPVSDELHPAVYLAIIGLMIWLVVSVWLLFDDWDYTELLFAVLTGFFFILIAIPGLLWLTWRNHPDPDAGTPQPTERFRTWASGGFAVWQTRLTGREAAVQVLLPVAAVAFGMTAIGIVFHLAGHA